MFCVSCGKKISDGTRFCPYCGSRNESVSRKREVSEFSQESTAKISYVGPRETSYDRDGFPEYGYDAPMDYRPRRLISVEKTSSSNKVLVVIIVVLGFLLVCMGSYFLLLKGDGDSKDEGRTNSSVAVGDEDEYEDEDSGDYSQGYKDEDEDGAYEDESAAQASGQVYEDCQFPRSSVQRLTDADLAGCSEDAIQIGINEIYARHGRIFETKPYDTMFDDRDWYVPRYTQEEFDDSVLNAVEEWNVQFLAKKRKKLQEKRQ